MIPSDKAATTLAESASSRTRSSRLDRVDGRILTTQSPPDQGSQQMGTQQNPDVPPMTAIGPACERDYRAEVARILGQMMEHAQRAGKSRYQVASEVSELAGKVVSKYMLDAYSAYSRNQYNAPGWLIPLLEKVCGCRLYTQWLVDLHDGQFYEGRDTLLVELGRLTQEQSVLAERARTIQNQLKIESPSGSA